MAPSESETEIRRLEARPGCTTEIQLEFGDLDKAQIERVVIILKKNQNIKSVVFTDSTIGKDNVNLIVKILNETAITTLNISNCNIMPDEGVKIGKALQNNKFLEKLVISYNRIGDNAIKEIATALKTSTKLNNY